MPEEVTIESLSLMLRMKHDSVLRRGKPRLGQVLPDGQIDLVVDVTPTPSKIWWQCLNAAAEGTGMEGRVVPSGNTALAVQSSEDEMEADIRRIEELMATANDVYDRKFCEAKTQYAALVNQPQDADLLAEKQRKLEEKLRRF